MDFNAIYDAVAPYLGTSGMAIAIITILSGLFKILSLSKQVKGLFKNVHAESLEVLKKAFPEEIIVSMQPIVKNEIEKVKLEILDAVNTNWLNQITANSELLQAIASALATQKTLPDSEKEKIAKLLKLDNIETTQSLKVELVQMPTEEKMGVSDISID